MMDLMMLIALVLLMAFPMALEFRAWKVLVPALVFTLLMALKIRAWDDLVMMVLIMPRVVQILLFLQCFPEGLFSAPVGLKMPITRPWPVPYTHVHPPKSPAA